MTEKLKSWLLNDRLFYGFLVILVGSASFVLGLQAGAVSDTAEREVKAPVTLKQALTEPARPPAEAAARPLEGEFVASRSGTRYHALSCPGAKQIKEENKIFFASALAAEAAGYKRAANCP